MTIEMLPTLNACLNFLSAVLLITGYSFIRRGDRKAHRFCMVTALGVSVVFLVSYLYHHYKVGIVFYQGHGFSRVFYFVILWTHTPLAALVPVLAILTLRQALKGNFVKHKYLAHWTFPIWLYVSVTGVLVYFMLYRGLLQ